MQLDSTALVLVMLLDSAQRKSLLMVWEILSNYVQWCVCVCVCVCVCILGVSAYTWRSRLLTENTFDVQQILYKTACRQSL
jgi:hypothetical protein